MWWRKDTLAEAGKLMLAASFSHLHKRQEACAEAWGLGACKRWDADMEQGTIRFVNADEWIITAPIQVVGTYSLKDFSWLWAWGHPSVESRLAEHARLARDYASEFRLKRFDTRVLTCTEADAWQFAAVACLVGNADGVYRAPFQDTLVFMTFGPVDIQKPPSN